MKKSTPSVKEATLTAFNSMPESFRGNYLHKVVKMITRRSGVYISSTLRKMRMLRSEGKINYVRVGNKEDSLYRKA